MRRTLALVGVLAVGALTACTPQQIADWVEWNKEDPAAAQEFARIPAVAASFESGEHIQRAAPQRASSGGTTVWDRLAQCESGGNWSINTGNGYYGGLQFLPSTWRAAGGSGMPHQASREEQIRVAENLRADAGFRPWPQCAAKLGLL